MKLKHWQGYGSVEAKKVSAATDKATGLKTVVVEVSGNHEWGLERNDSYDIHRWLGRFFKDCLSYTDIRSLSVDGGYRKKGSIDEEWCRYTVTYRVGV